MKSAFQSHPRRSFLKGAASITTGALLPAINSGWIRSFDDLKHLSSELVKNEDYWKMIQRQFAVEEGKIMVNAANLCPSPYVVSEAVIDYAKDLEKDVSFQNRDKYGELRTKALTLLAEMLKVEFSEVGITRNTSESNNIIVNGIDFNPEDEVIIWDQNHPTNSQSWEQRAKREGFKVVKIQVPKQPSSQKELFEPFEKAITPRTRLIAFSHISNVSGIALPAKQICTMAASKGIYTLIDGAQSFGFLDLDLHELGCDFYTASMHKWTMGPKETGILYVNKSKLSSLWPSIVSVGWDESNETTDERLCILGQRNDPNIPGVAESLMFQMAIGLSDIEKRIRQLNAYLKESIQEEMPNISFVTPLNSDLSGGITIINWPEDTRIKVFGGLYTDHGIASAPTGGLRFSPNIYNTLEDMDRIVEALKTYI